MSEMRQVRLQPNAQASRYVESFKSGIVSQELFNESVSTIGYRVKPASVYQDRINHIDVWIEKDGKRYSVDVKGLKRLSRYSDVQSNYVCLELHGNSERNLGWLYGGLADLIAFETANSFILVWRNKLADIAKFVVSPEEVASSSNAIYKIYNRRGYEQISWVHTSLLRNTWVLFEEISKVNVAVRFSDNKEGDLLNYVRG